LLPFLCKVEYFHWNMKMWDSPKPTCKGLHSPILYFCKHWCRDAQLWKYPTTWSVWSSCGFTFTYLSHYFLRQIYGTPSVYKYFTGLIKVCSGFDQSQIM
jgi:hypothetical protein